MTTYRLWPSTNGGPLVSYSSSPFIAAVQFAVKGGGNWLDGYWWWVPAGGDTGAVKCALWSVSIPSGGGGTVVPGSAVTSGTLTADSWNFIPLSVPLQLAPGWDTHDTANGSIYQAQVGWTPANGFPDTNGYWGSGGAGQAGIASGPLLAYSGSSGTANLLPYAAPSQGLFSTASADPAATFAGSTSGTDNFWVDVQVSDTAPAGYSGSYRIWPNKYDANAGTTGDAAVNYTVATEVSLSQACTLNSAWYFSPAAATTLATRADVWRVSDGANVASVTSPSWKTQSGATASAGVSSGAMGQWVSAAFPPGTVLPAGDYRVSVYNSAGSTDSAWSAKDAGTDYWGQTLTGAGSGGIANGPVTAPQYSAASAGYVFGGAGTDTPPWSSGGTAASHAQSVFYQPPASNGAAGFPQLYAAVSTDQTQCYWVDLEVTPLLAAAASPPLLVPPGRMSPMALRFARPYAAARPSAAATESGAFTPALPVPVTSLSAVTVHRGSFAVALPVPVTSLSAVTVHDGSLSIVLPALTTALAGVTVHNGGLSLPLPAPVTSLAGKTVHGGTLSIPLPAPATSLSGTAQHTESGSLAIALPAPSAALAGAVAHKGSLALALPAPAASLTGNSAATVSGSLAVVLPAPAASLAGKTVHGGTLDVQLPVPAASLTGTAQHTESGTFAVPLPAPAASLSGKVAHAGTFAVVFPAPAASLSGTAQHNESGSLAVPLPVPATSLSGTVSLPGGAVAGSFVIVLPPGQRSETESGTFTVVLPVPALALDGFKARAGVLTVTLPAPVASLAGNNGAWTGALAAVLPAPRTSLSAVVTHQGLLNISLAVPPAHLSRYQMFGAQSLGDCRPVLPALTMSVTAQVPDRGGQRTYFRGGRWYSAWLRRKEPE